jgi:hypothetical protein
MSRFVFGRSYVERRLEDEERLGVLRGFDIDSPLVIEHQTAPERHLCPVAVNQPRAGRDADLGSQRHAKALVALEAARADDEPLTPGISQIRGFDRPAIVSTWVVLCLRDRQGTRQSRLRPGLAVHGIRVEVQLSNTARSRVAEPGIHRAIELSPEAPADLPDDGDLGHRERGRASRADDGYKSIVGAPEGAEESPPVARDDLDDPSGDDTDQFVPLQIQRPRVVGLELEPTPFEAHHFTRDPITVGEGHDVSSSLRVSGGARRNHQSNTHRRVYDARQSSCHPVPVTYLRSATMTVPQRARSTLPTEYATP